MAKVIIEAINTPSIWQDGTEATLMIFSRHDFITANGQRIYQGELDQRKSAHLVVPLAVANSILTVPSIEIDSTTDSLTNRRARYDAHIVVNGRDYVHLLDFPVPHGSVNTTWGDLEIAKQAHVPLTTSDAYTTEQTDNKIALALGELRFASETRAGMTALDTDPTDPGFPIAVGINSPLLVQQETPIFVNALDNGIEGDCQVIEDATISLVTPTLLTSVTGGFSEADVDKVIAVPGAGVAGATLITTIAAVLGANSLTLTVAASTAVTNTRAVYGTNNLTALQTLATSITGLASKSTIYLPKGNYLFSTGTLTLPQGVTLQGCWETAPDHMGYRFAEEPKPMGGKGTTLVIVAGEGSASGRFMFLNTGSCLRGVSMFWPAQIASLATPKQYPWAIEMYGAGPTVENVELVNPYQGIYSHIGYRHRVANVKGTPLLTGVYASQLLGVSHFENIVFEAIYTFASPESGSFPMTPLMQWIHQNGTAFKIGRVDNACFYNCFSFACFKGFKFVVDASESTTFANGTGAPGGKAWAQFINCGADGSSYPVDIDDVQGNDATGAVGVSFIGCEFTAAQWFAFGGPELYAVFGRSTLTGRVSLTDCRFHLSNRAINIDGGGRLNVTGCFFQDWTVNAIRIAAGTATITGSTFKIGSPGPIIVLTGVPWVSASGNMFEYQDHAVWDISGLTAGSQFSEGGNTYSDSPTNVAVSFSNGWVNFGGALQAVTYMKRDGRVYLRGTMKSGTVGTGVAAFTLPTGHRPLASVVFPVNSNSLLGIVQVAASGVVSVEAGSNVSVSLDGISFAVR